MSYNIQLSVEETKLTPFIILAVVIAVRQDSMGQIVSDAVDKYGDVYLGCYMVGPPGATFNYQPPLGQEVIIVKSGAEGNNYIIGAINGQEARGYVQPPETARPEQTPSSQDYVTTHAGDYDVRLNANTRFNLNINTGVTSEGFNNNIQLKGGVLRVSQNGESDERLLNAYQTIDSLLKMYERLHSDFNRLVEESILTRDLAINLVQRLSALAVGNPTTPLTGALLGSALVEPLSLANIHDFLLEPSTLVSVETFNQDLDRSINDSITVPLSGPLN